MELRREAADSARLVELGVEEISCPTELLCPITREVLSEPVVASDGFTYERAALMTLLSSHTNPESPLTRQPLQHTFLPNVTLLALIREHRQYALRLAEAGVAYAQVTARPRLPTRPTPPSRPLRPTLPKPTESMAKSQPLRSKSVAAAAEPSAPAAAVGRASSSTAPPEHVRVGIRASTRAAGRKRGRGA